MNLLLLYRALHRERTETEKQASWDPSLYELEEKIRRILRQTDAERGTKFRVEVVPVDDAPMTETVTFAEAARRLNVDRSTIHRRVNKGLIATVDRGGRRGIPIEEVQ